MAVDLCEGDTSRIHFGYPSMERGPSDSLPGHFGRYVVMDAGTRDAGRCREAQRYIATNHIDTIFGFDQPVRRPIYRYFRDAGVRRFISYWGAPMSSVFGPFKRTLKRVEVALSRHGPDQYIFESYGMADSAVLGRGIPRSRISVVHLGVDTERWRPGLDDADYVYRKFEIPRQRRVFFYSGHMEERKGISVIMRAANSLAKSRTHDDWGIVLFGNRPSEDIPYINMLSAEARTHVVFGGYRTDLNLMQRGCYAGIIASTGWDSFTCSSLEMQSSGLPLLVSDLTGLRESVAPGQTGFRFPPGDHEQLAGLLSKLLDDVELRNRLSRQARTRILNQFSMEAQCANLVATVQRVVGQ
jgi:glycosyltransferase involved in cell wall biosynthesis